MKKKIILLTTITSILVTLLIVVGIVNASNSKNYLVEVIDDGSSNLNGNEQTEITKKIIQDNSSNLIYEVKLKNKLQVSSTKEVTLLIDTSKSTGINDPEQNVRGKAANLAETLFDNVSGIKISVADSNEIKLNKSTSKQTVLDTINALTVEDGKSVDEAIVTAKTSFSNEANAKCMIVFTDATDTMNELKKVQDDGISVVSILDNMTRESFEENGVSTIGTTYMIDNIDTENIMGALNKTLTNFVVTDEFSEEVKKYFDFSIVNKEDADVV